MSENWVFVQQIALILVSIATGGLLVPVINYIKELVGASGNWARAITILFAFVVGLAIAVTEGVISGEMQVEELSTIVLFVLASSQYWYQQLTDED